MASTPRIQLRLDPDERLRWEAAADRVGLDLSSFIRTSVTKEVCSQEKELGR